MAPAALAAPATSLLGDRHSAARRAAVARARPLARARRRRGAVALGGPAALVFALAALFTAIGTGHKPAQAALLPALADAARASSPRPTRCGARSTASASWPAR